MAGGSKSRKKPLGGLRSIGSLRPGAMPVAIDFGAGSIKALQLSPGNPESLVAAAELQTPEDCLYDPAKRIQYQIDALPKLIKKAKFKTQRAVCAIPSPLLFCKHLQFQKSDGVSTEDMLNAALPRQIGCDPSMLLTRHFEVEQTARAGRTEVICFSAGRELVARLMHAIKAAKLEPVGIHNEFTALLRAFAPRDGDASEQDKTTLYVDLGRVSTNVMIARAGRMLFARTIGFGGLQLDQAITGQLKCSLSQARAQRLALTSLRPGADGAQDDAPVEGQPTVCEPADRAETPIASPATATVSRVTHQIDLSEPLEILVDEISMCLRYQRSLMPDAPVERAVFVGGESRHRPLCAEIARALRLPAQGGDPMTRIARSGSEACVDVDLSQAQPGWAVALGMCLSPTDL